MTSHYRPYLQNAPSYPNSEKACAADSHEAFCPILFCSMWSPKYLCADCYIKLVSSHVNHCRTDQILSRCRLKHYRMVDCNLFRWAGVAQKRLLGFAAFLTASSQSMQGLLCILLMAFFIRRQMRFASSRFGSLPEIFRTNMKRRVTTGT